MTVFSKIEIRLLSAAARSPQSAKMIFSCYIKYLWTAVLGKRNSYNFYKIDNKCQGSERSEPSVSTHKKQAGIQ